MISCDLLRRGRKTRVSTSKIGKIEKKIKKISGNFGRKLKKKPKIRKKLIFLTTTEKNDHQNPKYKFLLPTAPKKIFW